MLWWRDFPKCVVSSRIYSWPKGSLRHSFLLLSPALIVGCAVSMTWRPDFAIVGRKEEIDSGCWERKSGEVQSSHCSRIKSFRCTGIKMVFSVWRPQGWLGMKNNRIITSGVLWNHKDSSTFLNVPSSAQDHQQCPYVVNICPIYELNGLLLCYWVTDLSFQFIIMVSYDLIMYMIQEIVT